MSQNKDGLSGVALAKYLGITLKSAWGILQKIRKAISSRDHEYMLSGIVEMDVAYIGQKKQMVKMENI